MRGAVRCQLLQDHPGRHGDPVSVEQGIPIAVVVEIGAGRAAVAVDAIGGAVAAGKSRAGRSRDEDPRSWSQDRKIDEKEPWIARRAATGSLQPLEAL